MSLATAGVPLVDRPLARFVATGVRPAATDFSATVLWGDGTPAEAARVVANEDGTFSIVGSHTYRRPGTYRVRMMIRWPAARAARVVYTHARVAGDRT